MTRQLLLIFLLVPFALSAQTKETVAQLELSKKALEAQITNLQDSIKIVEQKIKMLKEERQEQNRYNVEVKPEIPQILVKKNSSLLSRPHHKGDVVVKIKKGTLVQKIDKTNGYYLVCIKGSCGYLPKSALDLKESSTN